MLMLGLALVGWFYTFDETYVLDTARITHQEGYAYHTVIDTGVGFPFVEITDSGGFPKRSAAVLNEGNAALGPAHAIHQNIREYGAGRFSHWDYGIYFSTSDNSDPRTNARTYSAKITFAGNKPFLFLIGLMAAAWIFISRRISAEMLSPEGAGRRRRNPRTFQMARLSIAVLRWSISDRTFWLLFAAIIVTGIAARLFWLVVNGMPFTVPDSGTYVAPALENPLFPFDETRTSGVPHLISLGLAVFGHPIGAVVTNNLLWLGSTVFFIFALRKTLNLKISALILTVYLTFMQKNLALEFLILSEHAARCMYLIVLAIMILNYRSPSRWVGGFLGVLVVFAIQVKPSGVAVLPVVAIFYGLAILLNKKRINAVLGSAAVFALVLVVSLGAYMGEFNKRYGSFAMSHFGAMNFYAQVAHLTNLDSDLHKGIKDELRTFLPIYSEFYAARGDIRWNWVIYGSVDERMKRDFGAKSPNKVINKFAGHDRKKAAEIYKDLSLEAVLSNKTGYLNLVRTMLERLWGYGFTTTYGDFFSGESLDRLHGPETDNIKTWFYPPNGKPSSPLRQRVHTELAAWKPLPVPEGSTIRNLYLGLYNNLQSLAWGMDFALGILIKVSLTLIGAALLSALWGVAKGRLWVSKGGQIRLKESFLMVHGPDLIISGLLGLTFLSYSMAISMYVTSDPLRFLSHVQDLSVTVFVLSVVIGLKLLRRGVLALVVSRQ